MMVSVSGGKETNDFEVSIKYKDVRWGSESGKMRGPGTEHFDITPGVVFSPNVRLKNNSDSRISAYICVGYR